MNSFLGERIIIDKDLAVKVGLREAVLLTIVAEQLRKAGFTDQGGVRWVRLPAYDLHKLAPFLSERTIRRLLAGLCANGYLHVADTANRYDRAKVYALGGDFL